MKRLVDLIKQHTDLFLDSVERRMGTSTHNKCTHQEVIDVIEASDWVELTELLKNPWYFHKPLSGVVYCLSDEDYDIKDSFILAFEQIQEEYFYV